jgi:hypothetical protein
MERLFIFKHSIPDPARPEPDGKGNKLFYGDKNACATKRFRVQPGYTEKGQDRFQAKQKEFAFDGFTLELRGRRR